MEIPCINKVILSYPILCREGGGVVAGGGGVVAGGGGGETESETCQQTTFQSC